MIKYNAFTRYSGTLKEERIINHSGEKGFWVVTDSAIYPTKHMRIFIINTPQV